MLYGKPERGGLNLAGCGAVSLSGICPSDHCELLTESRPSAIHATFVIGVNRLGIIVARGSSMARSIPTDV